MILCDIGNTSFHFFDMESGFDFKVFDFNLPVLERQIYFISVNDQKSAIFFKKYPSAINLEQKIVFDTNYQGMGIDRKVVCFGVENALIIDAGSAITVDIMENSKHIGGFILPGVLALLKSYSQISPKLTAEFEKNLNLAKIPTQTKDAINYGILKSIILPIKEVSIGKKVYFTGGDGELLSSFFAGAVYDKNMIFKSMIQIIKGNVC